MKKLLHFLKGYRKESILAPTFKMLEAIFELLVPVAVNPSSKKGYVIEYKCQKCGKHHNNKASDDDSQKALFSVMNGSYNKDKF